MIREKDDDLEYKISVTKKVEVMGLDFLVCIWREYLQASTISKNWLALGGQSLHDQQDPRCQSIKYIYIVRREWKQKKKYLGDYSKTQASLFSMSVSHVDVWQKTNTIL